MSYKPDESVWMAYLYGELEGQEKEKVEQYLRESAEARRQLEGFRQLRKMMSAVEDKEVITPPFFMQTQRHWYDVVNTSYFRMLSGIAATVLLIMFAGWLADARVHITNHEFTLRFGDPADVESTTPVATEEVVPALSNQEVQAMINESLEQHNDAVVNQWEESQKRLDASIKRNLADNSSRIDELVQQAAVASREQIESYVALLQTQHMQQVQDYYQMNAADQKKYMEELLVDFAKYLQQQRNDDLMIMQTRMNSIEQNTNIFKQETEQILSSIISNANVTTIKN